MFYREMVDYIYRSQPEALCVCFLPGSTASWVFLPLLQGGTRCKRQCLAGASGAQCIRAVEESVPRYESPMQWLQVAHDEQ
jgi:hypothetical protein